MSNISTSMKEGFLPRISMGYPSKHQKASSSFFSFDASKYSAAYKIFDDLKNINKKDSIKKTKFGHIKLQKTKELANHKLSNDEMERNQDEANNNEEKNNGFCFEYNDAKKLNMCYMNLNSLIAKSYPISSETYFTDFHHEMYKKYVKNEKAIIKSVTVEGYHFISVFVVVFFC